MADYVLTPLLPKYTEAQAVVKFLDKKSVAEIGDMRRRINDKTGDPQNTVNWSEPDEWIPERLTGRAQELAKELWENSKRIANPRYLWRIEQFTVWQNLLQKNEHYSITERGSKFIKGDSDTIKLVDSSEGLDFLLNKIKEYQPCKKGRMLGTWEEFLKAANSRMRTDNVIRYALGLRLANLLHRKLLKKSKSRYSLTNEGTTYSSSVGKHQQTEKDDILRLIKESNDSINDKLFADIKKIEPENFEHFIAYLLDKMEFGSIKVTQYSGDRGIDITAKKVDGLTEINHVFQVKRRQENIQSREIQEFAGAMGEKENADIGTFITTSKFTTGAKETAENLRKRGNKIITLIDGDELIELIKEHGIGIEEETFKMLDIDSSFFKQEFKEYSDEETSDEADS